MTNDTGEGLRAADSVRKVVFCTGKVRSPSAPRPPSPPPPPPPSPPPPPLHLPSGVLRLVGRAHRGQGGGRGYLTRRADLPLPLRPGAGARSRFAYDLGEFYIRRRALFCRRRSRSTPTPRWSGARRSLRTEARGSTRGRASSPPRATSAPSCPRTPPSSPRQPP